MRIYQLHKCLGEWEDYLDTIIGSYLREERAIEEKIKAEAKEEELIEKGNKCSRCPFLEEYPDDFDSFIIKHSDYCSDAKLELVEYGIDCENYHTHWDRATFYIKDVEVEE